MKVTFIPLDLKNSQFGPYENVERANLHNQTSNGIMMVPDHNLYFKNGNTAGIILPANAIYAILVEEDK